MPGPRLPAIRRACLQLLILPASDPPRLIRAASEQLQNSLPISIFLRMILSLWYTNASMMPDTVNTPPTMAHTFVMKWRKEFLWA